LPRLALAAVSAAAGIALLAGVLDLYAPPLADALVPDPTPVTEKPMVVASRDTNAIWTSGIHGDPMPQPALKGIHVHDH